MNRTASFGSAEADALYHARARRAARGADRRLRAHPSRRPQAPRRRRDSFRLARHAARIAAKTLGRMRMEFGTRPADVIAALGPGIGRCCYEVGTEVVKEFQRNFPKRANGSTGPTTSFRPAKTIRTGCRGSPWPAGTPAAAAARSSRSDCRESRDPRRRRRPAAPDFGVGLLHRLPHRYVLQLSPRARHRPPDGSHRHSLTIRRGLYPEGATRLKESLFVARNSYSEVGTPPLLPPAPTGRRRP